MRRATVIAVILFPALPLHAIADQTDDEPTPTWRLDCRAAPEAPAALDYALLPCATDRRPGNAAVIYNRLAIEFPPYGSEEKDRARSMTRWLSMTPDALPAEEVRAFLRPYQALITDLRLAACCESCNWEFPIRDREFYSIRLPDAQAMRGLAALVALQARLHIRAGRFDDALPLVQTGFTMARHISEQPFLLSALFGIVISEVMENTVLFWVRQPDAPNLYWALTTLPQPLVDLRSAAEAEGRALFFSFPEFLELDDNARPALYWEDVLDRVVAYFIKQVERVEDGFERRVPWALLALKQYPFAKRSLIERGRSAEEVELLPVAQILLIDAVHRYRIETDHAFKRLYLPYHLLQDGSNRFDTFRAPSDARYDFLPLRLLLPSVETFHLSRARHERRIALLRIVEALRRYAAAHASRLPENLEANVGVPVPLDPVTGKSFGFRFDGQTAIVEGVPPPGVAPSEGAIRLEMRIVK